MRCYRRSLKIHRCANDLSTMVSTASIPHSAQGAGALDAFREWLAADLLVRPVEQALVVSTVHLDQLPVARIGKSVTMLRRAPVEEGPADRQWEFADGSFDAVYVHRMIRIAAPPTWLGSAFRVLRPGGTLLAAADPADFRFAPLPVGGDVVLLHRVLQEAGFRRAELVWRTPLLIIVAAHRDNLPERQWN
jgi:SAM-dependent methyltransferase